jgi:hypothetical protein
MPADGAARSLFISLRARQAAAHKRKSMDEAARVGHKDGIAQEGSEWRRGRSRASILSQPDIPSTLAKLGGGARGTE